MTKGKIIRKTLWDYFIITLGCIIYALSFSVFFNSNNLAMGGFTGLAQIINHFIPALPIGIMVFVMNVPLLFAGFKKEGLKFLLASFYAISLTSVMIDLINIFFEFRKTDTLLACIFGSILIGASLGILMLKAATTGGTELLARLLKYKIHNLSIGKVCLIIDVTVICIYAISFRKFESALYGIIAMYISSIAIDTICYGSSNGKMAYIISDKNDEIMKTLLEQGLGVTLINGNGGWSGDGKKILLCTVKKNKIAAIKKAVSEIDPQKAFVIVCEAKEVFGEGFGDYTGIGI
ncbi:MAG: YitT family protein [Clostridia bacterium]|nr:YitT family protein [Clostridia bacterium]